MSGSIDYLAHVRTEDTLADCLTKSSAKPDNLIQSVFSGVLPNLDVHPEFRSLLKHKAFLVAWCAQHLRDIPDMIAFMDTPVCSLVHAYYSDTHAFASAYLHTQLGVESDLLPCAHTCDNSLDTCD